MRTLFLKLILPVAGIFSMINIDGQINGSYLDSIGINKPRKNQNLYKFLDNGDREIQYSYEKVESVSHKANPVLKDIGNGVMTIITGIGFNSSAEVNWKIPGIIKSNDSLSDWFVSVFCEGSVQKERERVQDSDGSWSVETNKTNVYDWNKDATGIIVEGNDTVGFFMIVMNPRDDKLLGPLYEKNMSDQQLKNSILKTDWTASWMQSLASDFAIIGSIREKKFTLCRDGYNRKVWIFTDNVIRCIFQEDLYSGVSKKNQIIPYFLMNKNFTDLDRRDLFRLAIMSRFLDKYLSSGF